MKTQLSGDEGRVGEWAWLDLAGIGVGGWNPSSGYRRFPVFWQEGMDLVFSSVKTQCRVHFVAVGLQTTLKIAEKVAEADPAATVLIVEVNQTSGFGVLPEPCGVVASLALLLQNRHPGFVGLDELSFFEPLTS